MTKRQALIGSSWAKAVPTRAETTARWVLQAWVSAFLMRWTRQHGQLQESTLDTAGRWLNTALRQVLVTTCSGVHISIKP